MQLEKYGYAVQVVTTGEQAVEAVETSSKIDLVLMDINLGDGIDGTEAAQIILKDHDIPIIFLALPGLWWETSENARLGV